MMPLGLTNVPSVRQVLVNDVLRDMLNRFVFVYIDDILIFSRTLFEHVQHVRQVLQRLLENRLFVKAEKWEFQRHSVSFLGYILGEGEVRMDPRKIQAVAEWLRPTCRCELQRFLSFANFYRHFIRGSSKVACPLTSLTSSVKHFLWSQEAKATFRELKRLLTSAPILTHPDPSHQFIVEVDASETGVGAVLFQRDTADGKPLRLFFSTVVASGTQL